MSYICLFHEESLDSLTGILKFCSSKTKHQIYITKVKIYMLRTKGFVIPSKLTKIFQKHEVLITVLGKINPFLSNRNLHMYTGPESYDKNLAMQLKDWEVKYTLVVISKVGRLICLNRRCMLQASPILHSICI